MKLEVEIISKETIKPSSPTPTHLHHYQLSFLDQIAPMVYNPLVLFYSNNNTLNTTTISNTLKHSLSNALTHFYPLAGRMNNNNTFIQCNDEGIPFIETKITNYKLKDIIQNPIPNELNRLIPFQLDEITNIMFGIQLNFFNCGGIAIGACISHQIADGLSFFNFLNSWANITTKSIFPKPHFDSSKLFPPKNISGFDPKSGITKENIVCKMFVFNADVVENLRSKYVNFNPTRVEALSAFIWSRYVDVINDGVQRNYIVVHAVNLRPKMEPPLPSESFGNYYRFTTTIPKMNGGEECYGLAKQVSDEIKKIDKDYVRKVREGKEHLEFLKDSFNKVIVKEELVVFNFTSLCRLPLYETDFGWGKPIWVGSPALTFKNLVVFVDCKDGGGIEAYVSLKEDDMVKFEADLELLACVNKSKTC